MKQWIAAAACAAGLYGQQPPAPAPAPTAAPAPAKDIPRVRMLDASSGVKQKSFSLPLVELRCPIGDEWFRGEVRLAGHRNGMMLDTRPIDGGESPWKLGKCPQHGFVMYKYAFTPEEIAALKACVASKAYADIRDKETPYYLAFQLMKAAGEKEEGVFKPILNATWEANPQQYPVYAKEALELMAGIIRDKRAAGGGPSFFDMLSGELERRTGQFDAARTRFEALKADAAFHTGVNGQVIDLQLQLIEAKDTATHPLPAGAK